VELKNKIEIGVILFIVGVILFSCTQPAVVLQKRTGLAYERGAPKGYLTYAYQVTALDTVPTDTVWVQSGEDFAIGDTMRINK